MLRKTMMAALAIVVIGLSGTAAHARAFGHYAGGFRSGPWVGPYGLLDFTETYYGVGFGNVYGYPGNYDEPPYEGCYVARQRVKTRHGWRVRSIDVCE